MCIRDRRCPNGAGGARNSGSFRQNTPTPRKVNNCITDVAPTVAARVPAPHDTGVSITSTVNISFSEPVDIKNGWLTIACHLSGSHGFTKTGGPTSFVAHPVSYTHLDVYKRQAFKVGLEGADGWQPVANFIAGTFLGGLSPAALETGFHVFWWVAISLIFLFLPYFPYTKHCLLYTSRCV